VPRRCCRRYTILQTLAGGHHRTQKLGSKFYLFTALLLDDLVLGALTVIEYPLDAVNPIASVTTTLNEYLPPAVGMPEIVPFGLIESPGGSAPDRLHVRGPDPPFAARFAENGEFTEAFGILRVDTDNGATAFKVNACVILRPALSTTVTVKTMADALRSDPDNTPLGDRVIARGGRPTTLQR